MFWTARILYGDVRRVPSTAICEPFGVDSTDSIVVLGSTSRTVVDVRPAESVTVRRMRNQTSAAVSNALSGTANVPDLVPGAGSRNGCVWMS